MYVFCDFKKILNWSPIEVNYILHWHILRMYVIYMYNTKIITTINQIMYKNNLDYIVPYEWLMSCTTYLMLICIFMLSKQMQAWL